MKLKEHIYTVLLVGFGRLAHINETYGYGYGNEVLKRIGQKLCALADGVGRVYRMEGSKFAVVSENRGRGDAEALYREIQRVFREGVGADGVQTNLIAYGGVMTMDETETSSGRTVYACLWKTCGNSR